MADFYIDNDEIRHFIQDEIVDKIKRECVPVDTTDMFDDMLDECYSFRSVGGYFTNMSPSKVLYEVDPIAYDMEHNNYVDSLLEDNDYMTIDEEVYETYYANIIVDDFKAECDEAGEDYFVWDGVEYEFTGEELLDALDEIEVQNIGEV